MDRGSFSVEVSLAATHGPSACRADACLPMCEHACASLHQRTAQPGRRPLLATLFASHRPLQVTLQVLLT